MDDLLLVATTVDSREVPSKSYWLGAVRPCMVF